MFEKEARFLQASLEELQEYLLQEQLFWPLSGVDVTIPRLTLSGFLLSLKRAESLAQTPAEQAQVAKIRVEAESIRQRYRVMWERKASHELDMRLRMWRNYLTDYRQNPGNHADEYPYQVRLRVMLALLAEEIRPAPHLQEAIAGLDALLRAVLIPSGFIWEAPLQAAFPQPDWWYLYGTLKS